ncbi:STAS domain-containing protein [Chondromyces crocatus]|nr:STAS domain-containing protein [Chondromyces crocatus]
MGGIDGASAGRSEDGSREGVPRELTISIETSLAGLMAGMQRMVGTERFNICLQSGGRESVAADWQILTSRPSFEEGFAELARIAGRAGWGRWELVALDRDRKEARFRVAGSWESVYQQALGVTWGASFLAGKLAGLCSYLFDADCWAEQTAYEVAGDPYDEFIVRLSNGTTEREVEDLLRSDVATRADLAVALETLRHEVEERRQTEQDLRDKLEVIRRQDEAIQALSTPVLQLWDGVLALPLIGAIDGRRAAAVTERLLGEIVRTASRFALLDLTGVDIVDTSTADHLLRVVRAVQLLGARAVITGINPAVAQTLTSLGVDLSALTTQQNLQEGLRYCIQESAPARGAKSPPRRPGP